VTVSAPGAPPEAVGAKLTLMVHELLAASEVPQVLVWGNGPEVLMLVIVRAEPPVFVKVTT
jgi:hypothetical protein